MIDTLREQWKAWEAMPYPAAEHPPGSDAGMVAGVDVALTDGAIGSILDDAFSRGILTEDSRHDLAYALADLETVVPLLTEDGRTYFARALELLRAVADADAATHRA